VALPFWPEPDKRQQLMCGLIPVLGLNADEVLSKIAWSFGSHGDLEGFLAAMVAMLIADVSFPYRQIHHPLDEWVTWYRKELEKNVYFAYQKIIRVQEGRRGYRVSVVGHEALMRDRRMDGGKAPFDLIGLASFLAAETEFPKLATELDVFCIEKAVPEYFRRVSQLSIRPGGTRPFLSLNCSPVLLRCWRFSEEAKRIEAALIALADTHKPDGDFHWLQIELSEMGAGTQPKTNVELQKRLCKTLNRLGVWLGIDDWGHEELDMRLSRWFPYFRFAKIDKAFLLAPSGGAAPEDQIKTETIGILFDHCGRLVVQEGLEFTPQGDGRFVINQMRDRLL
jgi:EAL domain-containing protein (putative c-di-GMP-specific phosphodiesterase class I)